MQTYTLKFVLVGNSGVGKSQLSRTFNNRAFHHDAQTTIGMEFAVRTLEFEKCLIKSQIWDTAGQERFEGMSEVYYRDAVGAILVYDICNKESLEDLKTTWLPQVRQYGQSNVLLMLVGNKFDKADSMEEPREVSIEDGIAYAKQENMDFTETSALTGYCVEQMFRRITLLAARKIVEVRDNIDLSSLPDGWLAIYDYEEGFHSIGSESRLKSIDSSRTTNPAKSSLVCSGEGDTANYTSENPVQQLPAALVTKVRYMNYWTGEIAPAEDYKEFPPATPALPGLIHVIDPSSPVASRKKRSKNDGERGSESSRASNTTDVPPTERTSSQKLFMSRSSDTSNSTKYGCRNCCAVM